jgi:hypothetical protein
LRSIVLDKRDNAGELDQVRQYFNILNKVDITDEEVEKYNIEANGPRITWDFSEDKDFSFSNAQLDLIKSTINDKKDWSLDTRVIDFVKKFGVDITDNEEHEDIIQPAE